MERSCRRAAERVRKIHEQEGEEQGDDTVLDAPASFDASWNSRGHSARDGIVACVAEETSQVLDATFLSNSCPQCTTLASAREDGKLDYLNHLKALAEHEETCSLNHNGSAQVPLL